MLMSKLKVPVGLVLALGLLTLGWGAYQGTRAAADDPPPTKEVAKAPAPEPSAKDQDDDVDLPAGPPLTQVRVRVDKNGKLVVKSAIRGRRTGDGDAPPEVTTIQIQRYVITEVQITDAKGRKIDESELIRLLKIETIAMASFTGEPVDPLHLRVLKESTLVFALPAPRAPAASGVPTGTNLVPNAKNGYAGH